MIYGKYMVIVMLFFVLSNLIVINIHAKKTFNNKKKSNHVIEYNTNSNVNRRTYNSNDNRYINNDERYAKNNNHQQPIKLKKGIASISKMQESEKHIFHFDHNNKRRNRRHLLKLDSEVALDDSIGIQKGGKGGQSSKPASKSTSRKSSKGGSKSGSSSSSSSSPKKSSKGGSNSIR